MALVKSPLPRNLSLFITCIRNEHKFMKFFAFCDFNLNDVRKLEHFLNEKSLDLENDVSYQYSYQLSPGSLCFVKSEIRDRTWCRARVKHVDLSPQQLCVDLVDYGDIEILPMSSVRRCMDAYMLNTPPLTTEFILADVVAANGMEWEPNAIEICKDELLFKNLSGYVVSDFGSIPFIRLAKPGEGEPFVQRLINAGLAKIESVDSIHSMHPKIELPPMYKFITLEIGTKHMVTVSCVVNVQHFYVQLTVAENELKNLMVAIERYVSTQHLEFLNIFNINIPCLCPAQFKSNSQCYYRAVVKEITSEKCTVFLVDYGSLLKVDRHVLRAIPKHFLGLNAQAIRCSLPETIQINVDIFNKIVSSHQHLPCTVLGVNRDAHIVELMHQNEGMFLNNIEQNAVQRSDFASENLKIGSTIPVTTSFLINPIKFYCQQVAHKTELDNVANQLVNAEKFPMIDKNNRQLIGHPVIAKFSEDGLWYRGKIVAINNKQESKVYFIDYGNTDDVTFEDLRLVSKELLYMPILALKFALHNMLSIEEDIANSNEVVGAFEDLTLDKVLFAEIKSKISEDMYSVILSDRECPQVSINEKMIKLMNAPKCVYPSVNSTEIIFITYYTSPSLFFGQFSKFDTEVLDKMQSDMNAYYKSLEPSNSHNFKVGDLVSAKYSEDDEFYRAKITVMNSSSAKVIFVDYGNADTIDFKDIHELHPKFCSHPIFGIECILQNCPGSAPIDKMEDIMMEKEIEVDLVKEISPGKWLVSLTQSYPGNASLFAQFELYENASRLTTSTAPASNLPNKSFNQQSSDIQSHSSKPFNQVENNNRNNFEKPNQDAISQNQTLCYEYDTCMISNGSYKEIYICLVKSPSEFYCQQISEGQRLQQLKENLQKMYNSKKENDMKLGVIKSNSPCCAIYEDDNMWYRAKITKFKEGSNSCEVFYVDYGNTETVSLSKIKQLHSDFFELPPQALRCCLFNIVSKSGTSWTTNATDDFSKMVGDKSFLAQFVKTDSNGTYLINLVDIKRLTNIVNEDFIKLGHGELSDSNKLLVVNAITASTSLDFNEPNITLGKSYDVTITWVTKNLKLFCHLQSDASKFKQMMSNIQDHYGVETSSYAECIDRPVSGMICIARFSADFGWYRARILDVEKQSVKVYYVDYGNSETIPKIDVRYILQDFTVLPIQAVNCFLRDIKLTVEKVDKSSIHSLLEGQLKCTFISKESDYYFADFLCDGKNVADELIKMNLVTSTKSSNSVSANLKTSSLLTTANLSSFEKGQLINVTVSFVESPKEFWCQAEDDGAEQLNELMILIESQYTGSSLNNDLYLEPGNLCIAKYSSDGSWYRAIVKNCTDQQVEVLFIDYGNSEIVNKTEIRAILPKLAELPAQAFKCCLYGLPSSYDKNCAETFKRIVEEAEELMGKIEKTCEDTIYITLFDNSNSEIEVNVLEEAFKVSAPVKEAEGINMELLTPKVPTGTHLGYVSSTQNPSTFYVQLASEETELESFFETIQGIYTAETDVPPPLTNVAVGIPCSTLYSADDAWYRAVIMDVQDDTVTVLFCDYGNIESISTSLLRELHQDISKRSPFAIPCRLANVRPIEENWTSVASETFLQITSDVALEINFIDQIVPAGVTIMNDGQSIADSLISSGLAVSISEDVATTALNLDADETSVKSANLKRLLPTKSFTAKLAYVVQYDKFFVTATSWDDELDDIITILEEMFSTDDNEELCLKSPDVGEFCIAKYSEDDTWYRALITNIDGLNATVKFIDYGNSETVEVDTLKQLTPKLLTYPACCIECKLLNVTSKNQCESQIVTELQNLVDSEIELEIDVINDDEPYLIKIKTDDVGDFANQLINKEIAVCGDNLPQVELEPSVEVVKEIDNESTNKTYPEQNVTETVKEIDNESTNKTYPEQNVTETVKEIDNESTNKTYPEQNVTETLLKVKFTFVEAWDKFHVSLVQGQENLDILMGQIQEFYSNQNNTLDLTFQNVQLQNEQPCIAKYSVDDMWYRALITSNIENSISVNFIDYGNTENVQLEDLRRITSKFLDLPPFAIQCTLLEAENNENATKSLQELYDLDMEVEIQIIDHSSPYTVRINNKDTTYPQRLISSNLSTLKVKACYFENGEKFFVIPLEWQNDLDLLTGKIEDHYGGEKVTSDLMCEVFEKDQPCIAKYNVDEMWYRAIVKSCSDSNVNVHFIDYGNTETIQITDLRKIIPHLLMSPPFALECALEDTSLDDEHQLKTFYDDETEFEIKIMDYSSPYKVKIETNKEIYPERFITTDVFKAKLCFVESWNKFFVTALDWQKDLYSILENMKSHYDDETNASHLILENVENNQMCIAKCGEDGMWYRAIVKSIICDDIMVNFVDYGNNEIVELKNLRKIIPDLQNVPPFSIECMFPEIELLDNSSISITERLRKLCDDEIELDIHVLDHTFPLKVKIISNNSDFIEELLSEGLVIENASINQIQDPDIFKENLKLVYCSLEDSTKCNIPIRPLPSGVISATLKHCHVSENKLLSLYIVESNFEDSLATLQEKLQEFYNDESKSDLAILEGDYCVAKFLDDNYWYRSLVLERHGDNVSVKFVDFGNREVINIDHIKELNQEFATQPNFCVECTVSGLQVIEGQEEILENTLLQYEGEIVMDFCDFNFKDNITCVKSLVTTDGIELLTSLFDEQLAKQVLPTHYPFDIFQCEISEHLVTGDLLLYLAPNNLKEDYISLKKTLQSRYDEFILNEPLTIYLNRLYVMKKESEYFRVYVESINDIVNVFSIDTGMNYSVPLTDIRCLPEEFCHIPPFTLQCHLAFVSTTNDQENVRLNLLKITGGKTITCKLTGALRSKNYHEVQIFVDNVNILPQLYANELENIMVSNIETGIDEYSISAIQGDFIDTCSDTMGENNENLFKTSNLKMCEDDITNFLLSESENVLPPTLTNNNLTDTSQLEKTYEDNYEITDMDEEEMSSGHIIVEDNGFGEETKGVIEEMNEEKPHEDNDAIDSSSVTFDFQPQLKEQSDLENESESLKSKQEQYSSETISESRDLKCDSSDQDSNKIVTKVNTEHENSAEHAENPTEEFFDASNDITSSEVISSQTEDVLSNLNNSNTKQRYLSLGQVEVNITEVKIQDKQIFIAAMPINLKSDFEQLQICLNDFYSTEDNSQSEFNLGPCAIQSSNGIWHRGDILDINENDITVVYLDSGHGEVVNSSQIKDLNLQFQVEPSFITWCCIWGVTCVDEKTVSLILNKILKDTVTMIEVLDEHYPCHVKFCKDKDVFQMLLAENSVVVDTDKNQSLEEHTVLDTNLCNQNVTKYSENFHELSSDPNQNSEELSTHLDNETVN